MDSTRFLGVQFQTNQSQKGCVHRKYVSAHELQSSKKCIRPLLQKVPNSEPVTTRLSKMKEQRKKSTWTHKSFTVFTTQNTKLKWTESAWVWELVSGLHGILAPSNQQRWLFPEKVWVLIVVVQMHSGWKTQQ